MTPDSVHDKSPGSKVNTHQRIPLPIMSIDIQGECLLLTEALGLTNSPEERKIQVPPELFN